MRVRCALGERSAALLLLLAQATMIQAPTIGKAQERIAYTLTDEPAEGDAGAWRVEVVVRGLDTNAGPLGFASTGWGWPAGEFMGESGNGQYLELIESEPPVAERAPDGSTLTLATPEDWNQPVRLAYRIRLALRGSETHKRYGLMPTRGDGYAFGYWTSMLLQPTRDGTPLAAPVEIEIRAATDDGVIVTGWAGRAVGRQCVTPDKPFGNGPIAFGEPVGTASAQAGPVLIEGFQFSRGADATQQVVDLLRTLIPAIERHTNWPARNPARVFLTDAMGGGMGSDYGLHINLPADAKADHAREPFFKTTVAHELFHDWLGIRLHESHGSLVWFREGFTEYFSLWLSAAGGIISQADFAATLDRYDRFARTGTSLGQVAFADPGVNWRDGDGPNELMAYRGGPVLALALDVDLRAAGHAGLLQLIRDFLSRETHVFAPDDLRAWFADYGLEERWRTSVAGLEVPTAADSLARAGFVRTDVEVDVAYLGLQTIEEKPIWRVLGVDPAGPAARAGVRVGDVINGYFPDNAVPTPLKELSTPYTFGLGRFTPGIEGSFLGIKRGEEQLKIHVEPALRHWGLRPAWRASQATEAFFSFEP